MSNAPQQTCGPIMTYKASGAVSKFTFVVAVLAATASVSAPAGANPANVIGIAQEDAASGVGVGVLVSGMGRVIAGETLAAGDLLGADSTGRAIKWRGGTIAGIAESAGAVGEYVAVQLFIANDQSIVRLVAAAGGVTAKTLVIAGAVAGETSPAGADQASKILGVALNTAAAGAPVFVKTAGITRLTASAAIAYGDTIGSAAAGQGKTYSAGQQAGIALSAAAGAASDFDFLVSPRI